MENKRGQGLSVSAIILIVLGVVVLVMLIIGFTLGWSTILPFVKTNNVDTIVQACATACTTQSAYDYCSVARELNDGTNKIKTTCAIFANEPSLKGNYSVHDCDLDCKKNCEELIIDGKKGDVTLNSGYNVTSLAKSLTTGQNCFIAK